jgi:hypothetical protein
VRAFLHTWRSVIQVRQFDYDAELRGTPWAGHPFFGNHSAVRAAMRAPATYSDLVRMLLLHNHGGLWLDNDIILYRVSRCVWGGGGGGRGVMLRGTGLKDLAGASGSKVCMCVCVWGEGAGVGSHLGGYWRRMQAPAVWVRQEAAAGHARCLTA